MKDILYSNAVCSLCTLRTMGNRLTKKAAAADTKAPFNVSAILCRRCLAEVRTLALWAISARTFNIFSSIRLFNLKFQSAKIKMQITFYFL